MNRLKSIFMSRVIVFSTSFLFGMSAGVLAFSQQLPETRLKTASPARFAENDTDVELHLSAVKKDDDEDQEELLALLTVLEEETEVATKTKMNKDYVPGIVTILHGEQLEALGVRTVAEGLTLVPGIELSRIATGEPTLKIRGLSFPFNTGNVKVMLNSIALSRESSGINSSLLLTPVAQIDRVEVIRGPGSSIYGDFAMAGVVNIITKNSGGRVFAGGGDNQSIGGGGHYTYRGKDDAFGIGVNASLVDGGENAAAAGTDPDEQRFTGVFNIEYKNFKLTAEGVRRELEYTHSPLPQRVDLVGNLPPLEDASLLENTKSDKLEESWAIEGRQTIELGSSASLEPYISYLRNEQETEQPLFEFRGDRWETGVDFSWSPWSNHDLLFGLSYTASAIDHAITQMPGETAWGISDINRRNYSLSLQDQMTLGTHLTLTLGLRFDDYDDVGDILTPRIAAVYRLGENHIFKAQYSEGFRAPTFWELYPSGVANDDLDFEVIGTTELAYVYRRPQSVGRFTLFYSEVDDGIVMTPENSFANTAASDAKGVEVEWEQQLGEKVRWLANVSYVDAQESLSTGSASNPKLGIANWMGNLAIYFQPFPKYMLSGRLLYVGDRETTLGNLDGYEKIDLTLSRMDLFTKGVTLSVGVKNLLDETIVHVTEFPTGLGEDEYWSRTFWAQLSYDF